MSLFSTHSSIISTNQFFIQQRAIPSIICGYGKLIVSAMFLRSEWVQNIFILHRFSMSLMIQSCNYCVNSLQSHPLCLKFPEVTLVHINLTTSRLLVSVLTVQVQGKSNFSKFLFNEFL